MEFFKNRLKNLRKDKNLTLHELAKIVGTTKSTLSRYEIGDGKPSQDIIENLADFFEVTTDYLLGRTNQKYFKQDETIAFHTDKKLSDEDLKTIRNIIDAYINSKEK